MHLGIISMTGSIYVRKAIGCWLWSLTSNFPRKKKTAQQIVFAHGSSPKFQVMPTQKGLVK